MKKYVFMALALLLVGCASKPMVNVENRPIPPSAQQMPLDRIEREIIAAGQERSWQIVREAPGHLVATQVRSTYNASVDIRFNQRVYSITHRSSDGMREKDGTIHKRYNLWVKNLQRDIDRHLINAALARS
jgi:uncharacterized protein YcfL